MQRVKRILILGTSIGLLMAVVIHAAGSSGCGTTRAAPRTVAAPALQAPAPSAAAVPEPPARAARPASVSSSPTGSRASHGSPPATEPPLVAPRFFPATKAAPVFFGRDFDAATQQQQQGGR
jgi:hypothetical protein